MPACMPDNKSQEKNVQMATKSTGLSRERAHVTCWGGILLIIKEVCAEEVVERESHATHEQEATVDTN